MSGPDASHSEMPGFPFPRSPGRELGEPLLDALLDGQSLPPDAPEELCPVAEMLADLAGPAEPGELAGEDAARAAFGRCPSPVGVSPGARPSFRGPSWYSRGARLAAALTAAAVGLGGAAAAYAGVLPAPVQDFAHHMIGAPPVHRADPQEQQPGHPGESQPGRGDADRKKAHATPGAAPPGDGKGHGKPLPSPSKGHAKPSAPPGRSTHPRAPKPRGRVR